MVLLLQVCGQRTNLMLVVINITYKLGIAELVLFTTVNICRVARETTHAFDL